ncbi:MAG: hypothetical protein ACYTDX_10370 [Planctomycetota bacterium]|jgi:hypothetical protein
MFSLLDRTRRQVLALAALALATPLTASQETFVETFSDNSNVGQWSWGTGGESISPLNGHPGAFLQDLTLFTALPTLSTGAGVSSPFTGNYVDKHVRSIGVDLVTLDKQFAVESNRFLTLVLLEDAGTPGNPNDDRGAYFVGDTVVPNAGVPLDTPAGWTAFEFEVDAQASAAPPGWVMFSFSGPIPTWQQLMPNVDSVEFWSGVPGVIYLFDSWDVGADNLRITTETCQEDLGFGGPGQALLSMCGDELATGNTSTLSLSEAPVSALGFLFYGFDNLQPASLLGGQLLPFPFQGMEAFVTDASGSLSAGVPGGGGPATLYIQALILDGTLPEGVAFSNALALEFLP